MQEMVNIYVYGKKYSVPGDLTIMTAMEYAGYQLKRGCGCRHGFCARTDLGLLISKCTIISGKIVVPRSAIAGNTFVTSSI